MNLINKTYRNRLILVCLAFLTISFAGCKRDFLDRNPQGEYTADNYPFPEGSGVYDAFVYSAYDALRSYDVTIIPFVSAVCIRADDSDKGSTPSDGPTSIEMDNFTLTPTNGLVGGLWNGHYNLINKCNIVLDQIENDPNPNTPAEAKLVAEAEAKLLRGYAYFMMVRFFGRVPLIDKVFKDPAAQSNVPQSDPAQIYALIESDLQFAAANLPVSWPSVFIGRATKGTANGLLTKVYITQKKWSMALTTSGAVINSGAYDLSTSYNDIFGESGENSKESVFEVQATSFMNEKRAFGSQYASFMGVRGTGSWNLGWGFNVPNPGLVAAYEPGDPRKARTILYAGGTSIYGEAVPLGLPNPMYNHKVHSSPAYRNRFLDNFSYWMNIRLLRYADVVLLYAEAANETDNTTEALAKLEMVRARARAGNSTVLPKVTTTDKEELRQAIRHERRIELALEHERFFDLVRWGIAGEALQAIGKNFITGKHELLPIPQTQIDITNGKLVQNPGY